MNWQKTKFRISTRRSLLVSIASLQFFVASVCYRPTFCAAQSDESTTKPNVVLMMADDLGYADLGCYGSDQNKTPVLDQLAEDGIRLTSFYAGCTICTPSRMALLAGAYPTRLGWRGGVVGYGVDPQNGLTPDVVTLAELFQANDYETGMIGKWHLGDTESMSPRNQGFEYAFYVDKSNNQTKKLWRNGELIEDPFDNRRLSEQFAAECVEFIQAHHEKPFFLYVPFTAPHFPAEAHPEWQARSANQAYGDVVEELDARVGEILAALTAHNIEENTIVIFISDNGVEPGQRKWAKATPYRGLKWSTLEGGNRVPGIIRWPQKITPGSVSDAIIGAIDLYPTLAQACEIDLDAYDLPIQTFDGMNVLSTLLQDRNAHHPRDSFLYWQGWGTLQAIRVGAWKLYVDEVKEIPSSTAGPALFNLEKDPEERHDVSNMNADRVAAMMESAKRQLSEIQARSFDLGGPSESIREKPTPPKWLNGSASSTPRF